MSDENKGLVVRVICADGMVVLTGDAKVIVQKGTRGRRAAYTAATILPLTRKPAHGYWLLADEGPGARVEVWRRIARWQVLKPKE